MKRGDVYFYNWKRVVDNEIQKPLWSLREERGGSEQAVRALGQGWDTAEVERLLSLNPLPTVPGAVIFEVTVHQLLRTSPKQLRLLVRCAIVKSLEHLRGKRLISRFIMEEDCVVRRAMARPEYARCMDRGDRPVAVQATTAQVGTLGRGETT